MTAQEEQLVERVLEEGYDWVPLELNKVDEMRELLRAHSGIKRSVCRHPIGIFICTVPSGIKHQRHVAHGSGIVLQVEWAVPTGLEVGEGM